MSRDRLGQLVRGLGALLGLLVLLAGVPVALVAVAAWPLPHALPSLDAIGQALEQGWLPSGVVVIKALAIVCWVAWAELAACAAVELVAAFNGRGQAPRVPLAGPLQPLVAYLVAVVLLAFSPGTGTHSESPGPASLPAAVASYAPAAPALHPVSLQRPAQSLPHAAAPAAPQAPAPKQVVVRPRDNLWDLAQRHLGDPMRWREIWELNRHHPQPDGRLLTDPDRIRTGWTLILPADAVGADDRAYFAANPAPSGIGVPRLRAALVLPSAPTTGPEAGAEAAIPPPATGSVAQQAPTSDASPLPVPPVSVELASGSMVAVSFAAGVAAAVATGRLRRRRLYVPSRPRPAVLPAASDVGPAIRMLLHAAAPSPLPEDSGAETAATKRPPAFPYAGLRDPEPARLPVGVRSGRPVELELTRMGGLALDGPGAPGVCRAVVAALLAKGGAGVNQLLIPEPAARRLLPGLESGAGIRLTADLDNALTEAEVEVVRRTRLLAAHEVADFAAYRKACPEDVLPAVTVVADEVGDGYRGRLRAVAELGRRLGVGVLTCETQEEWGARLHVDERGTARDVSPERLAAEVDGAALHRLTEAELEEVLHALATAREEGPTRVDKVHDDVQILVPAVAAAVDNAGGGVANASRPEPAEAVTTAAGSAVRVRLLGAYRIEVEGEELRTGLRSAARQLLAYYLLRPDGATMEATSEALWPDVDLARGPERFWTALGNLRSRIRQATGEERALIEKEGERYRVQPGVFDVDVWRLQAALVEAGEGSGDDAVEAALERAAGAYGGELLEGCFYEWAEPAREELRQRALDALMRLSELRARCGDTEGALAAVEQAIGADPYAEELYRRAIVLLGELDRVDVARQLFRRLGTRLGDLDADPGEETVRLLDGLSANDTAGRRTDAARGPFRA